MRIGYRRVGWFVALSLAVIGLVSVARTASEPQVLSFQAGTPGAVIKQAVVRFSDPMVAFGDPRAASPFEISDCPVKGTSRWVDDRSWVYDFDRALPGGTNCKFNLKAGLKDAAGERVRGTRTFTIVTGGPSIRATLPKEENDSIEEEQIFLLALNTTVDPHSVEKDAGCEVNGVSERIGMQVMGNDVRDKILTELAQHPNWQVQSFLDEGQIILPKATNTGSSDAIVAVSKKWWHVWHYQGDGARSVVPTLKLDPKVFASVVAVKCQRPLPPGHEVRVFWPASVRSADGKLKAGRDQRLSFTVREAFSAKVSCQRTNAEAGCNPLKPIEVQFTDKIGIDKAKSIHLQITDDTGAVRDIVPTFDAKKKLPTIVDSIKFAGPFPEQAKITVQLPPGLTDDSGRVLTNAARFPLPVVVDKAPPLVKFNGMFGILEAREGGVLPVTVRDVEPQLLGKQLAINGKQLRLGESDTEIAGWLLQLKNSERNTYSEEKITDGKTRSVSTTGSTPTLVSAEAQPLKVPLAGHGQDFEVVGIPLGKPGFYVVELASPALGAALLGKATPRYVTTGALVTNMSVHFKWGREASLVWVTALENAKPVAGASIAITDACGGGELLASGKTDKDGKLTVQKGLPQPEGYDSCENNPNHPLMISARTGDDMSFTLTDWGKGLEPSDFHYEFGYQYKAENIHAVYDRTLIRAGDTIHAKLIARRPVATGFARPLASRSGVLHIHHQGSDDDFPQNFTLPVNGVAEISWTAPKNAKLGDYDLRFEVGSEKNSINGGFRIDEYRLPVMQASITGPKGQQINPTSLPVDLFAGYLSGGGAGNLPVRVRAQMEARSYSPKNYDGFEWGGAAVVEGTVALDSDNQNESAQTSKARAQLIPGTLGANGATRMIIANLEPVHEASSLTVEMDYADPNGETLTASTHIPVDQAAIHIGLRSTGWLMKADDLRLQIATLDGNDKPVSGQSIKVQLFSREIISVRKRLIGGFYAYDNSVTTRKLDASCAPATDAHGLADCKLAPNISGEVYVEATTTDARGNVARSVKSVWLAGKDDWWFGGDNGDRMDLIAEANSYNPGDTAKFQVRMPFREATALVTVEREGVLSSFVTQLSGKDPVVSVPLDGSYAPNVYVSVLAVRGRVSGFRVWLADLGHRWHLNWLSDMAGEPTALVDLSKPSYRLGIAQIRVGWAAHKLDVAVTTDHPTYHVRQLANVDVVVHAPKNKPLPTDAEVAIVGIDEALLQLQPNPSWALLDAMMGERALGVLTSTAQTQVVGKRHYGKKALAAGGGGGDGASGQTRSNFQPLLLWRGRVRLDGTGQAHVQVPMNDALSSFRIVAIATAGDDLFGTGEAKVRTVQDLQAFSGVPPLVREGDALSAVFTLRNGSTHALDVTATAATLPAVLHMGPLHVHLKPGEASQVRWAFTTPMGIPGLVWTLNAVASDGTTKDSVRAVQIIEPAVPVHVLQATLSQLGAAGLGMPIMLPKDAIAGRGGVSVALSSSIAGSLDGVKEYMREYPFTCLEQQTSKAIALNDKTMWSGIAGSLPIYLDRDGLVRYFPDERMEGSDTLTAYVLSITHAAGYPIPDEARARMIAGLTAYVDGRLERHTWAIENRTERRLAAIEALSRYGAAKPGMVDALAVDTPRLPTSALLDWISILDHLPGIADATKKKADAEAIFRSRLDFQGTSMAFTSVGSDYLWWLMVSNDENAVRAVDLFADNISWKDDIGRMLRGTIFRQEHGHWDSTPANAWGALAVRHFMASHEAVPVNGQTQVTLGSSSRTQSWPAKNPAPLQLPWPVGTGKLNINHVGDGQPWAIITSRAALPLKQPLNSGYKVSKIITPVQVAVKGRYSAGDVVRVTLTIEAAAERNWVVVDDPVPGGATIIGANANQSALLGTKASSGDGTATPAFVEQRQAGYRAYYSYPPAGTFSTEYVMRLNAAGTFNLPPTRVEALYTPEAFAMSPNATVSVGAK